MIAALLEIIVSFVLEFVIEALVEIGTEVGIYSFDRARESKTVSPILRGVLYIIIGLILGLLSTIVIPVHIIERSLVRIPLMLMSLISMGLMLCFTSWFLYRKDRHQPFWSTQKFLTGVAFGAAYSLSRAYFVDVV